MSLPWLGLILATQGIRLARISIVLLCLGNCASLASFDLFTVFEVMLEGKPWLPLFYAYQASENQPCLGHCAS